jgi:hypothetical protein
MCCEPVACSSSYIIDTEGQKADNTTQSRPKYQDGDPNARRSAAALLPVASAAAARARAQLQALSELRSAVACGHRSGLYFVPLRKPTGMSDTTS